MLARPTPNTPVVATPTLNLCCPRRTRRLILWRLRKTAPARFEYGVPDSFRADLFELTRNGSEEQYLAMIHRIPCEDSGLANTTAWSCYTPDGNPRRPSPGLHNMWLG
jgi:dimethylglycine dehydrogenase